MPTVEERVSGLEKVLQDFIVNVGIEFNKLYNSQLRTEAELREFKEEMRLFREESEKDRTALHEEMKAFKEEMKEFKDEMREFKDEMREETKKRNKAWGELSKKMGTLYEDLIAPALEPVLKQYFNCEVTIEGQRMKKRKGGEYYEVDAIAGCDNKVFMIEVRATPRINYIDDLKEKRQRFFEFFSEFMGKELYIILGSITFPDDVIRYASKKGIYVMGWREWEYMDILNFDEVKED